MTQDEQEALSFRYVMPRAVRLSSGRYAMFIDGRELEIVDGHNLLSRLPSVGELEHEYEVARSYADAKRASSGKLTSLNLADLGLYNGVER